MTSEEFKARIAEVEKQQAINQKIVDDLLDKGDFLDDDGYPTDDALKIVELWNSSDKIGWFDFISNIWYLGSWGWREGEAPSEYRKDETVYRYEISTAGWSGNESVIYAMENNKNYLWGMTWVQSRRGGHYIFEVDNEDL